MKKITLVLLVLLTLMFLLFTTPATALPTNSLPKPSEVFKSLPVDPQIIIDEWKAAEVLRPEQMDIAIVVFTNPKDGMYTTAEITFVVEGFSTKLICVCFVDKLGIIEVYVMNLISGKFEQIPEPTSQNSI